MRKSRVVIRTDFSPATCLICGKTIQRLTILHLRIHDMTAKEYMAKYPSAYMGCNPKEAYENMKICGRILGNTNWNKKQSVETIEKRVSHYRGKTYEEVMGTERAKELSEVRKHAYDNMTPERREVYRKSAYNASRAHADKMHYDIEYRDKYCKMRKGMWENADTNTRNGWIKACMLGVHIKPNKPETYISKVLDFLFPDEWKYVGDGQLIINGYNPDFIDTNGQKKIIELYGTYWHSSKFNGNSAKAEEQRKIKRYSELGYDTLIIWEHELKHQRKLIKKITQFVAGGVRSTPVGLYF